MNDSLLIRALQESDAAKVLDYTKSIGGESNFLMECDLTSRKEQQYDNTTSN